MMTETPPTGISTVPATGTETSAAEGRASDAAADAPSAPDATASAPAEPQADGGTTDAPITRQRVLDAEAWAEQGIQLCRKARWRDAIEPLRRAAELHGEHPTAHYYLGEAYNHTDDLPAALAAFEAAVRANPAMWRAHKGIGIVLDRMRRPQEAATAYQRARELQRTAGPGSGGSGAGAGG
jgi:tetratricopeptide (TPR) repeat protein